VPYHISQLRIATLSPSLMAYLCAHDLGVCVLLLLLTLTQSCLGVRTRTLPNVNFQFDDGTCDERQKAFITGAFDDAIYMARSVFESISDLSNDYMLYDLFGIRAIEIVSAKPILDMYYQIATKWEIKASCGVESQAPCNNQFIYGGTDASKGVRVDGTLKVGIVFCEEFFRLPSVQSRRNLTLSQLQKSTVVRRYDLGYYSYNQGIWFPYVVVNDFSQQRLTNHIRNLYASRVVQAHRETDFTDKRHRGSLGQNLQLHRLNTGS
jgi:hypothetical protein